MEIDFENTDSMGLHDRDGDNEEYHNFRRFHKRRIKSDDISLTTDEPEN